MGADGRNELILQIVAAAFWAGANGAMAQAEPRAAGGFMKLARKHAERVGALVRTIDREAARPTPGEAASPLQRSPEGR